MTHANFLWNLVKTTQDFVFFETVKNFPRLEKLFIDFITKTKNLKLLLLLFFQQDKI